jgi:hypothetical protein
MRCVSSPAPVTIAAATIWCQLEVLLMEMVLTWRQNVVVVVV